MDTITIRDIRSNLADIINQVAYGQKRITIERRNKKVAVMIPVEDMMLLEAVEDKIDLDAAHKALRERGVVSWDKLKKELGL